MRVNIRRELLEEVRSIEARIVAAEVGEVVEPVLVWRGSDEGKQGGKIGGDLERAQWTAHRNMRARRKGILDHGKWPIAWPGAVCGLGEGWRWAVGRVENGISNF